MNYEFDKEEKLSTKQLKCHLLLNDIVCATPSSDRTFLQLTRLTRLTIPSKILNFVVYEQYEQFGDCAADKVNY